MTREYVPGRLTVNNNKLIKRYERDSHEYSLYEDFHDKSEI